MMPSCRIPQAPRAAGRYLLNWLRCRSLTWLLTAGPAIACAAHASAEDAPPAPPIDAQAGAEFFEKRVRPLLVQHCQACHGADTQEAGIRLDSRDAVLKGGSAGAIVAAGDPDHSRLIEVIGYQRDVQMPPDGKLADEALSDLRHWVKLGLPWGAETPPAAAEGATNSAAPAKDTIAERIVRSRASHWAFQPIRKHEAPVVADTAWAASDIDRFILAALDAKGLKPSPPATPRVLLRRVTLDLTGLPATADEVDAFERAVRDTSLDTALAAAVDRLLASPAYGERWGRHWLDVARYADTKGYVFTEDTRYPHAYTYRDYVVRALNDDLPYDQFVRQQIAADLSDTSSDPRPLAALGLLTVGSRFMNNPHDQIDDRIDVVTRGFLGLTVTCARCHDHKYDPISTADYYALYGVFASTIEPSEKPLIAMPEENAAYTAHRAELTKRRQALEAFLTVQQQQLAAGLRERVREYLVEVVRRPPQTPAQDPMVSLSPEELKPEAIKRWRKYLDGRRARRSEVFAVWPRLAKLPAEGFSAAAAELLAGWPTPDAAPAAADSNNKPDDDRSAGDKPNSRPPQPLHPQVKAALTSSPLGSMQDVAERLGDLLAGADRQWRELLAAHEQAVAQATAGAQPAPAAPTALPDAGSEALRQALYSEEVPTVVTADNAPPLLDRVAGNDYGRLRREIDQWQTHSPAEPPRAMSVVDAVTPHEPRIFLRGNPHRHGDVVPRSYVQVLTADGERHAFEHGSGRGELAAAITSPENPLTARVIVNRVWQQHFGAGLVLTPSEFGLRSDPPSHPELLDYLAATFRDDGWSLKRLHRRIVLSRVYQQASDHRADCAAIDPENRLLWRANRRRLEFEAIRDSLLAVAGNLDPAVGGRPMNLAGKPYTHRRTIYGFIDRGDMASLLRTFDFPAPDASSPERSRTTVPQQALFAMNSPFVIEQAKAAAARAIGTMPIADPSITNPASRIEALYRVVLGRSAAPDELLLAEQFLAEASSAANTSADVQNDHLAAFEQLAQILLATNEFVFVD
ncbi:MAG: PSD1 and planctomycete cytochrome C domain-containing protein [Pirellulales bacterium]|nr:PSD1 and planctomycete cytochrome C domain-containing protein [Pirellulales bacterium]